MLKKHYKSALIILIGLGCVFYNCKGTASKGSTQKRNKNDTLYIDTIQAKVTLIKEYNIGEYPFVLNKKEDKLHIFPHFIFYADSNLYLYTLSKKMVAFNTYTKVTKVFSKIDSFLAKSYGETGITGFFVLGNNIYIGAGCTEKSNEILVFNKQSQFLLKRYNAFSSCFNTFGVISNGYIYTYNALYINMLQNINSNKYDSFPLNGINPEITYVYNDTIAVSYGWGPVVSLFVKNTHGESKDFNFGKFDRETIYFSGITKSYLLWTNSKQDGVWLYNRFSHKRKLALFDIDFLKLKKIYPDEDSRDGIRVFPKDDHSCFYTIVTNNKICIYNITW